SDQNARRAGAGPWQPDCASGELDPAPRGGRAIPHDDGAPLVDPLQIEHISALLAPHIKQVLKRRLFARTVRAGPTLAQDVRFAGALVGIDFAGGRHVAARDEGEAVPALIAVPAPAVQLRITRGAPRAGERIGAVGLEERAV